MTRGVGRVSRLSLVCQLSSEPVMTEELVSRLAHINHLELLKSFPHHRPHSHLYQRALPALSTLGRFCKINCSILYTVSASHSQITRNS